MQLNPYLAFKGNCEEAFKFYAEVLGGQILAMIKHRDTDKPELLCSGPGRLCEALAITRSLDGASLLRAPLSLAAPVKRPQIVRGIRIGLSKGREAERRFGLKDSVFLSKKFPDKPKA